MIFIIKDEYKGVYPAKIREHKFQFIAADIHATLQVWKILGLGQDSCLYSFKQDHVKFITPLEEALK